MNPEPALPIPISLVDNKFLIFDVDAVAYLRRVHHICGVMGGTLPQHPSQNLFLGLPMQVMPEEAQILVEKGAGYIVDDTQAHDQALRKYDSVRHFDYMANVRRKAEQAGKIRSGIKEQQKKVAMKKEKLKKSKLDIEQESEITDQQLLDNQSLAEDNTAEAVFDVERLSSSLSREVSMSDETGTETLCSDSRHPPTSYEMNSSSPQATIQPSISAAALSLNINRPPDLPYITPTTSIPLILSEPDITILKASATECGSSQTVPNLPASYPLYRHLNSKHYYIMPGLRFGCRYCVYPGDPLRYHSHFLATSYDWDEEINLMDIVGGGRLGTGVKKGWLIGGEERQCQQSLQSQSSPAAAAVAAARTTKTDDENEERSDQPNKNHNGVTRTQHSGAENPKVRTFSIEWAAM